jgi:hypothetical protein
MLFDSDFYENAGESLKLNNYEAINPKCRGIYALHQRREQGIYFNQGPFKQLRKIYEELQILRRKFIDVDDCKGLIDRCEKLFRVIKGQSLDHQFTWSLKLMNFLIEVKKFVETYTNSSEFMKMAEIRLQKEYFERITKLHFQLTEYLQLLNILEGNEVDWQNIHIKVQ